ncbi:hypothetical protein HYR65_00365, partial [Candidatus Azambacteria bacterium]|nr:hypothetical protein [Candidatus Azambacteria bacterium]
MKTDKNKSHRAEHMDEEEFVQFYLEHENKGSNVYFASDDRAAKTQEGVTATRERRERSSR